MARIGIITCSNMTNDLACSSNACLEDSHVSKGEFARYAEQGGTQVVGIISCSGCPTLIAPDKIVRRVRTLVASGVDAIHFSYCIENYCPFKNKYWSILQARFPEVEFVSGTHEMPGEAHIEEMNQFVKNALCQQNLSMADVLEKRNSSDDTIRE